MISELRWSTLAAMARATQAVGLRVIPCSIRSIRASNHDL